MSTVAEQTERAIAQVAEKIRGLESTLERQRAERNRLIVKRAALEPAISNRALGELAGVSHVYVWTLITEADAPVG